MTARSLALATALMTATPALAEFAKVSNEDEFRQIVAGKTLTRPLVRLEVSPEGEIRGRGAQWDVSGNWTWRNGYFCRDLYWGDSELGYNCQEVRVRPGQIRFTSDFGEGDSADFRLRN